MYLSMWLELASAVLTLGLLLVAWIQFRKFNKQVRAELAYKIYQDIIVWFGGHEEAYDWLHSAFKRGKLKRNFNDWKFNDFLGYFEAIWSFSKKGLMEKEIVYDLFSDTIINSFEMNKGELLEIISELRKGKYGSDIYEGAEELYMEMKKIAESKKQSASVKAR